MILKTIAYSTSNHKGGLKARLFPIIKKQTRHLILSLWIHQFYLFIYFHTIILKSTQFQLFPYIACNNILVLVIYFITLPDKLISRKVVIWSVFPTSILANTIFLHTEYTSLQSESAISQTSFDWSNLWSEFPYINGLPFYQ